MADCVASILLSDGTDKADLSVVHDLANAELGNGSDNFDDNTRGWQWIHRGGHTYEVAETGGELVMDKAASGAADVGGYESTTTAEYINAGDYDIVIDFSNFSCTTNQASSNLISLSVSAGGEGSSIGRRKDSGVNIMEWSHTGEATVSEASVLTSGKMRLTRVGDTVSAYYYDESNWQHMGTHEGKSTAIGLLRIFAVIRDGETLTGTFDNFDITVGGFFDSSNPSPNVSPWNGFPIGTEVKMDTLDINEGSEGSLLYQFATNNGPLNGSNLTLAQLANAVNNFTVTDATNSLRIVVIFVSDGTQKTAVGVSGSVTYSIVLVCDYPAEADVRDGVDYDSANLTGAAAIPGASDVRLGVDTDATTGTAAIPGAADTRLGIDVDATTGTAAIPGSNDVRSPVPTDATTGNYVPADIAVVLEDEKYGSLGTEFTGTLVPFKASYELPQEVILEDEEIIIIQECI